jgi:hypothetical protein
VKARRIVFLTRRTLAVLIVLLVILAVYLAIDAAVGSADQTEADLFVLFLLALVSLPLLFLWAVLTIVQNGARSPFIQSV